MWATFSGRSQDLRRKHPDNIPMDARVDGSGKCLQQEGDRLIFITYERSPVQLRLSDASTVDVGHSGALGMLGCTATVKARHQELVAV